MIPTASILFRFALLTACVVGVTGVAVLNGSSDLPASDIVKALFSGEETSAHGDTLGIVVDIRLPRIALALIAGAGLAIAGTGTQAVLNNPLVSPSILGLSSGAAFGACAAILFGTLYGGRAGDTVITLCAFIGAMSAALLAYVFASMVRASRETVILAGVAVGFIFSGATLFLQYLAPWEDLRSMVFWGVGSLWNARPSLLMPLGLTVAGAAAVLMLLASRLNALALGDETAASVGVSVRAVRLITLSVCAVLCAVIVCATGAIGFIGLVAPHMARSIFGLDHRHLLPASLLMGGAVLLIADTAARLLIAPQELPVGIMTALIGGPFFLMLLIRRKRDWWGPQ